MALIGKSLDINTALRAACGAAKMLALSEGVQCPYTLPDFKAVQCPGVPATHIDEPAEKQFKRILVFLRSIQQGIIPPTNIATLSDEEEKAFKQEIQIAIKAHDDAKENVIPIDEWLVHTVFRTPNPKSFVNTINTVMKPFITGGGNGSTPLPILVSRCKYDGHPNESTFARFISHLRKSDDELKYYFEYTDGKARNWFYTSADISASNTLDTISILVFSRDKYNKLYGPGKGVDDIPDPLNPDKQTTIRGLFYIMTDNTLKYDIDTPGLLDYVIQGAELSNRYIIKHLFERNAVIDIHPWLMYLLQTTPLAFMTGSFGGNMTPAAQFPLAFYIVAYFVANQPLYSKNPADFYRKPIAEKKKEMLAALNANKAELTKRIADGYVWLGQTPPGIGALLASLGGNLSAVTHRFESVAGKAGAALEKAGKAFTGIFTRSRTKPNTGQVGGKRVTRKVRHQI
jgi:hypothetical protein